MRMRSWGAWVVVAVVATLDPIRADGETTAAPRVTARAAVVMDARTGEILWARNPDLELPPASTTKVMTAILALESGRLHQPLAASPEACQVVPSKVHLQPGQRVSLEDLVYAILLNSANDASVVIAEHLAGSVAAFGDRMTARARQIGALRTRFVNPHGLTAEGHYSTASDLATIFRHALEVPRFREIIATKSLIIGIENSPRKIALRSHNRLLEGYRIPVIGKTGYTIPAKKCFIGSGMHQDREIVVAVLGSNDLWGDTKRLLEYGFGDSLPTLPDVRRAKSRPSKKSIATNRTRAGSRSRSVGAAKRYAIQVGTFDRMASAQRLQRTLGRRGYDAAIDRVAQGRGKNKRTRYRVHVGSYRDRRQAESAARTVAAHVKSAPQIVHR